MRVAGVGDLKTFSGGHLNMDRYVVLSCWALGVLVAACGDDVTPDAGSDASVDSGPRDAGRDADIRRDANVDAEVLVDAGTDAEVLVDAGMDAEAVLDAAVDAEVLVDAGTDSAVDFDGGAACATPCSNGNACDGLEICVDGACTPGTPLICDDALSCTTDTCVPATGCAATPLDTDADGDSDCTDCAISDPAIRNGAAEVCNGLDDNCNGATDEGVSATNYADCDGDMWATETAITFDGCMPPPVTDTGCGTAAQAWTTRVPTFADFDCADNDPRGRSGTTAFYTTPIPDAFPESDYDFNCDFSEELQVPLNGSCVLVGAACTTRTGWAAGPIPDCGVVSLAITGCTAACVPTTASRTQGCR